MSITMRIIQTFDPSHEKEFMELEKEFAVLEKARPDFPKARRMQPVAGSEPCNTLVWECDFPDLESARSALDLFGGDAAHEELAQKQRPYFEQVRIEFYNNLDF